MTKHFKLISETIWDKDYEIIVEQTSANDPGFMRVRGPYISTEVKNANGRVYDKVYMATVVKMFKEQYIDTKQALGELNHPDGLEINPDRVCHRIVSLTESGNDWIGESIVLSSNPTKGIIGTPTGDIMKSIIQHGGKLGMSTRGVGSIDENSNRIDEKSEYNLITVDCVTSPSGKGCWVDGILESKAFMVDNHGTFIECAYDNFAKKMAKMPKKERNEHIAKAFDQFLKEITTR